MTPHNTPGWHPDPAGSDQERYWDGTAWTDQLRDATAEAPTTEWPPPGETSDAPSGTKKAPSEPGAAPTPALSPGLRRGLLTGLAVLVGLGLLAGAFFLGQSTRKPDTQVTAEKVAAVDAAVDRTRTADRKVRLKAVKSAVERTKKRNRTVIRRVVRKLKKSGDKKAAASYAAGNSSGYSSGYDTGEQDGLTKATDGVTCSDDKDVTWLPYCY